MVSERPEVATGRGGAKSPALLRAVQAMPLPLRPVRIRLFASAREAVGSPTLLWRVPATGVTVSELVERLGREYPRLRPTLRVSRFVRNEEYLRDRNERIRPGDEFAVHPPYGGG